MGDCLGGVGPFCGSNRKPLVALVIPGIAAEHGIHLHGIAETQETYDILNIARRVGDATLLSKEDVVSSILFDEAVNACRDNISCAVRVTQTDQRQLPLSQQAVKEKMERLVPETRARIESQADRFLSNAQALIERLRK